MVFTGNGVLRRILGVILGVDFDTLGRVVFECFGGIMGKSLLIRVCLEVFLGVGSSLDLKGCFCGILMLN